jgi:serine/threonine-protein kinase
VKPANLLVRPDGTVVLVDFGVARSSAATSATTGDRVVGTALYMAPEQASGRPVSPATDIYALGAVGYHCLAGYPPFDGTPLQVALRHVADPPPPLPPGIPPAVGALVMRALAKRPRDRFPDAASIAAAARAAASGRFGGTATVGLVRAPGGPRTLTAPIARTAPDALTADETLARRDRDRRLLAALACAIGMTLLLGVVGVLVLHGARGAGGASPADRPPSTGPLNPPRTLRSPPSSRRRPVAWPGPAS